MWPVSGQKAIATFACAAGTSGAKMRRTLGLAVFGGMLGVTLFGIFLTPVFFYTLLRRGRR